MGTYVLIQTGRNKWKKQGVIVEKLDYRQYRIKVLGSGRVTLRNRRFIKPCAAITPPSQPTPLTSPTPKTTIINMDCELESHPRQTEDTRAHPQLPQQSVDSEPPISQQPQVDSEPPQPRVSPSQRSTAATTQQPSLRSSARLQHQPPQQYETDPAQLPRELRNLLSHNNPGLLD